VVIHVKVITLHGKGSKSEIQRACYGSTSILEADESDGLFRAILRVEDKDEERAAHLAQYQADRFASFLWGARVFDEPPSTTVWDT